MATEEPKCIQLADIAACTALYRKAYTSYNEIFERKASALDARARQQGRQNPEVQSLYSSRAKMYRDLQCLPDSVFEGYVREDLREMGKMDTDNNGFLDSQEFTTAMKDKLDMKEDDCKKAFALWDVDSGGAVGPHEFCSMLAIYRAEYAVVFQDAEDQAAYAIIDTIVPGGVCGVACASYFGAACSLCTLCLSWLPMYCIMKKMEQNALDPTAQRKMEEKAAHDLEKIEKEAKKRLIKALLQGPQRDGATILTSDNALQTEM